MPQVNNAPSVSAVGLAVRPGANGSMGRVRPADPPLSARRVRSLSGSSNNAPGTRGLCGILKSLDTGGDRCVSKSPSNSGSIPQMSPLRPVSLRGGGAASTAKAFIFNALALWDHHPALNPESVTQTGASGSGGLRAWGLGVCGPWALLPLYFRSSPAAGLQDKHSLQVALQNQTDDHCSEVQLSSRQRRYVTLCTPSQGCLENICCFRHLFLQCLTTI